MKRILATLYLFILIGVCCAQERGGGDPVVIAPLITSVLSKAKVSGSLEYWGRCDGARDFPKINLASDYSGSPLETLRQMFADDPEMQVTQEPDGTIRMIETDVPRDLLDTWISHISFDGGTRKTTLANGAMKIEPWLIDDPNDALGMVVSAPELREFMKIRNIELPRRLDFMSRLVSANTPHISGDLDNVTFSQSLDHLLKIFPGFWIYENCSSAKKKRVVDLRFYLNDEGGPAEVNQP